MLGRHPPARLLCVPGLGLDRTAWRPTIEAMRNPRRWAQSTAAPLPGYGVRPSDRDDLRPASLGARLAAERLTDSSAPTVLVGHSASCQIVVHAARLARQRVCVLVLVGPTTDPRAASWPRLAGRWLRTAGWERPGQVPLLARTYSRTGLLWILRAMDAARREDVRASLREVTCPVLVVRGRHDRICPEDWARELAAAAPGGSRVVTLRKGAHMVPLTHGGTLAAAVCGTLG
jgi:pimeloyl-ACP methyl ester carboxylesterase